MVLHLRCHAAAVHGNKVYVLGGRDERHDNLRNVVEVNDIADTE
jgi:hypothetical protein